MKVLFSFVAQPEQILLELAAGLLVDGAERLVHQQHVGLHRQRPGQADPLAHAAGKLVRVFVLEAGQADFGDVVPRDRLALGLVDAAQFQPEGDVAEHGRPGHQREILEHEGALRTRPAHRRPLTSTSPDVAGSRPAMILSKVVLPQPDGPSSEVSWPRGKSMLMESSA